MKSYGQFCSIARALDLLGERWTLLIVRELLCGSTRFTELQQGIPRVSRTMLSARLKELLDAGVIARAVGADGPAYELTRAGQELASVVHALGTWGQQWLPRHFQTEQLDLDTLAWDMHRRVNLDALPTAPVLLRIECSQPGHRSKVRFLLLRRTEVSVCSTNPGFPEALVVRAPLATLTAWWRGDIELAAARAGGLVLEGRPAWVKAFPSWFARYLLASVKPVRTGGTDFVPHPSARGR
jgi:DNA-binding HxlR family transcriptional regulator